MFNKHIIVVLTAIGIAKKTSTAQTTIEASSSSSRILESEPFFCHEALDCEECTFNGCSWAAGQCVNSCWEIADTSCYSAVELGLTSQQVCELVREEQNNWAICSAAAHDCRSCTSTKLSDGVSHCHWYNDQVSSGGGWCGTGDCDRYGNCGGSTTCSGWDNDDSAGTKRTIMIPPPKHDTMAIVQEQAGSSSSSSSATSCDTRTSCSTCLSEGSNCAWVDGLCHESCDIVYDAACFTLGSAPELNGEEICQLVETEEADQNTCQAATTCQECTSIQKLDGFSKCSWYTDGEGNEWCGTGACDMNGICGSSDSSKCNTSPAAAAAAHGNTRGGGAHKRNKIESSFFKAILP